MYFDSSRLVGSGALECLRVSGFGFGAIYVGKPGSLNPES